MRAKWHWLVSLLHSQRACPTGPNIGDFVGYGSAATCFEGAGPTANLSNTTAALQIVDMVFGLQDTDNNNADFLVGAPNPRSRTPAVIGTTPSNGAFGSFEFEYYNQL